ncbi:MAG: hypothetical protein K8U03_20540 [Planctomycetia bacterium]|nr:hypothetical protein [Planctomycetia bacterium]
MKRLFPIVLLLLLVHSTAAHDPSRKAADKQRGGVVRVEPDEHDEHDPVAANSPARWWKGNLHTHTLWSDGDDFPEMVAEWYRTQGYHFLGLSDHNILAQGQRWKARDSILKRGGPTVVEKYLARYGSSWVETRGSGDATEVRLKPLDEFRALVEERGKFLMIPSEEISDKVDGAPLHINATNILEAVQPLGGATVTEAITNNLRNLHDQAERSGREILAHLNHPNFGYAVTAEDLAHAVLERHFEVYNGHPGVHQLGDDHHPSVDRIWDICNTIRLVDLKAAPLFGMATDDSHSYHGKPEASHPGRGWVMVRSTHLTPEYIVRAIKAGDFYASSGVVLTEARYDAEHKSLELEIEPHGDAVFTTQFIGTLRGVDVVGRPIAAPPPEANSKEKKPTRRSHKYSDEIGKVLATATGPKARYVFTGQELYVRAVVTSSQAADDPSFEGQRKQAWTQPVGWEIPKTKAVTEPK